MDLLRMALLQGQLDKLNRGDKLSPKEREGLIGARQAVEKLNVVRDMFKPEFVGPLKGRVSNVKDMLGVLGPSEAVFRSQFQEFKNELIKARSGGAVTPQEADRLEKEISNFNVSPDVYLARLERAINSIKRSSNVQLRSLTDQGFNTQGFQPFIQENQPQSAVPVFNSEEEARAAGHGTGDRVRIIGLGVGTLD